MLAIPDDPMPFIVLSVSCHYGMPSRFLPLHVTRETFELHSFVALPPIEFHLTTQTKSVSSAELAQVAYASGEDRTSRGLHSP